MVGDDQVIAGIELLAKLPALLPQQERDVPAAGGLVVVVAAPGDALTLELDVVVVLIDSFLRVL